MREPVQKVEQMKLKAAPKIDPGRVYSVTELAPLMGLECSELRYRLGLSEEDPIHVKPVPGRKKRGPWRIVGREGIAWGKRVAHLPDKGLRRLAT